MEIRKIDKPKGILPEITKKRVAAYARVSKHDEDQLDSLSAQRSYYETLINGKGIEVYFEKENIWTLNAKGELMITIMSSLAQEESRSISENTTWGKRKQFAEAKAALPSVGSLGTTRISR